MPKLMLPMIPPRDNGYPSDLVSVVKDDDRGYTWIGLGGFTGSSSRYSSSRYLTKLRFLHLDKIYLFENS
jgi:hypothetical protein